MKSLSVEEFFGEANPFTGLASRKPASSNVASPSKEVFGAATIADDDEFNALPEVERRKVSQLISSGTDFHIKDGKVVEGLTTAPEQTTESVEEFFGAPVADGQPAVAAESEDKKQTLGDMFDAAGNWIGGQWEMPDPKKASPGSLLVSPGANPLMPKFIREPVQETIGAAYDKFKNRILTELGQIKPGDRNYDPEILKFSPTNPLGIGIDPSVMDAGAFHASERRAIRRQAEQEAKIFPGTSINGEILPTENASGFFANLGNPVQLMLQESLPADVMVGLSTLDQGEYKKFMEARKIADQFRIITNPSKYPAVSVEAARKAIADRTAKADPTIRQMWNDLVSAYQSDPGKFGAMFANSIMADPELLAAPVGIGAKPLQTIRAARGAQTAGRAMKLADRLLDAGATGGALNVGLELAEDFRNHEDTNSGELLNAFAFGAGTSAPFGIFFRGDKSLRALREKKLTGSDLDAAMRDVAQQENLIEDVVNSTDIIYTPDGTPLPADAKHRIEVMLGISEKTPAEKKAWLKDRQKQLREVFDTEQVYPRQYAIRDVNGNIIENAGDSTPAALALFQGEERAARVASLADQARQRAERDASQSAAAAKAQQMAGRTAQERAVASEQELQAAEASGNPEAVNAVSRVAAEDKIIAAAMENEDAVRKAMAEVVKRDGKSKKGKGKYQKGEIDPELLARLGVGSLFAGTAYGLSVQENKNKNAFLAGLTGLLLPGGGRNVKSMMRQAGAISSEGDIISALVKAGKMRFTRSTDEAAIKLNQTVERFRQGDERAFQEIYKEYYPKLTRYASKFVRGKEEALGMGAEDLAQDAMVQIYKNIDKYQEGTNFNAWAYDILKNKAINELRSAKSQREGGNFTFESAEGKEMTTAFGEKFQEDMFDRGVGSHLEDTPENRAISEEVLSQYERAVNTLPEQQRKMFLMNAIDQLSYGEIADQLNMSYEAVKKSILRAQEAIQESLKKGLAAKKMLAETPLALTEPSVKRGRGRPRKQAGEIDQRLMNTMALAGLGAGVGAYLADQNKLMGATVGALAPILLRTRNGKGVTFAKQIVEQLDDKVGVLSTQVKNISEPLWIRLVEHEKKVLQNTHRYFKEVDPFLVKLQALPKDTQDILSRAIMTGKAEVTNRLLNVLNDSELTAAWKQTRSVLDSVKDQLTALGRFKGGVLDYFPRIVKDSEGLLNAIGKEKRTFIENALNDAESAALKERGTKLTDLERSLIINKILANPEWQSKQPNWAKYRGVEEITPELQQYYYSPTESLHTYLRSAVEDIERAKFFGKDLKVSEVKGQKFTNTNASVGQLLEGMFKKGEIDRTQQEKLTSLLKDRFNSGEKAPHEILQAAKNLSYAGLLGNPLSASVQLGDTILQFFAQDIRSTLDALVRKLSGNQRVSVKDFGLTDHIAEEFVDSSRLAKTVKKIFKYSLFSGVDTFGKDIALNAAISRAGRLAKSEEGIAKLAARYQKALGEVEFKQLVKDLQKGDITDLVQTVAFAELSRTQPVSRLELPPAYLRNPNGRLLYQYKTFMIKQIDLLRREAGQDIATGIREKKPGQVTKGVKNLAGLALALGLSGMATAKIKDFLLNTGLSFAGFERQDKELQLADIPMNMFKTFGLSQYVLDQMLGVDKEEAKERRENGENVRPQEAKPWQTLAGIVAPTSVLQIMDAAINRPDGEDAEYIDEPILGYLPYIGPHMREMQKRRKAERK